MNTSCSSTVIIVNYFLFCVFSLADLFTYNALHAFGLHIFGLGNLTILYLDLIDHISLTLGLFDL